MEKCETLEAIWMSSSFDVLSNKDPMFWESDGCRPTLDNCDKSENLFEQHWTLDGGYMSKARLEYISPAFGGEFNKQLCKLAINLVPISHLHC